MASENPNTPSSGSHKHTSDPFHSMLTNPEVVNLMKNFFALCSNLKTSSEVSPFKEEVVEEPLKQLTLDGWVQKLNKKREAISKEQTSAGSSTFWKKFSTKNSTELQCKTNVNRCMFQDDVPIESIPGTSTSTNEFMNIRPAFLQYTISEDKLVPVEKEPDKSEVTYAEMFRTIKLPGSVNSPALLVDENNYPVNLNTESPALIYFRPNDESNSEPYFSVNNAKNSVGMTSEKIETNEDVHIIYESPNSELLNTNLKTIDVNMSSNQINVIVDGSDNLLPVSHVDTTNMSSVFFNPNFGFYAIADHDFEAPLPEGLPEKEQDKCNASIESGSNLNLAKSPKKKLKSPKAKKTISEVTDTEIVGSVSTINSSQQTNSSSGKEDSPSRFLYSPDPIFKPTTEERCTKVSEQPEKAQNSFNDFCMVKNNNFSEYGKVTFIKKQTPTKCSDLPPNVLFQKANKVNVDEVTNEMELFVDQNDLEVGRTEEVCLTTSDSNQSIDLTFDDSCVPKEKPCNLSTVNKKTSKTTECKQQKQDKRTENCSQLFKELSLQKQNQDILNTPQSSDSLLFKNSDEGENRDADQNVSKVQYHIRRKLESDNLKRNVKRPTFTPKMKRNNRGRFKHQSTDKPTNMSNLSDFEKEKHEDSTTWSGTNAPPLEKDLSLNETDSPPVSYNLRRRSANSTFQNLLGQLKRSKKNESKDRDEMQSSTGKSVRKLSETEDQLCDSFKESISGKAECIIGKQVSISGQNSEENVEASKTESSLRVSPRFAKSSPSGKNRQISSISPKSSNNPMHAKSDTEASAMLCQSPLIESKEDCSVVSVDKKCETKKLKETNKRKKHSFENPASDGTNCDVTDDPPNKKTKHATRKIGAHTDAQECILEPKVSPQNKKSSDYHKKQNSGTKTKRQDSPKELINKPSCTKTGEELNFLDEKQYPDAKDDLLDDSIGNKQANHEKNKFTMRRTQVHHLTDSNVKKKTRDSKSKKNYIEISNSESSENELLISAVAKCDELTIALNATRSCDNQSKLPLKNVNINREKQNKERQHINQKHSLSSNHSKSRHSVSEESNLSLNKELNSPIANSDKNNRLDEEKSTSLKSKQDKNHSKLQQIEKTFSKKRQKQKKSPKKTPVSTTPNKAPVEISPQSNSEKKSSIKSKESDFANSNTNISNLKQSEKDISETKSSKCTESQKVHQNKSNSPNFKEEQTNAEIVNFKFTKELQQMSVCTEFDLICISNQPHDANVDCLSVSTPLSKEAKSSERSKKKITKEIQSECVSGNENKKIPISKSPETSPNERGEENVDFISSKNKNWKKFPLKIKLRNVKKKVTSKSAKCTSEKSLNTSSECEKDSIDCIFESVLSENHHSVDSLAVEGLQREIKESKESETSEPINKVSILKDGQRSLERLTDSCSFTTKGVTEDKDFNKLKTQLSKIENLRNEKFKPDSDIKEDNSVEISDHDYNLLTPNIDNDSCAEHDDAHSNGNRKSYDYLVKEKIPNSRIPVLCIEKLNIDVNLVNSKLNKLNNFKKVHSSFSDNSDEECNEKASGTNSRYNSLEKLSNSPLKSSSTSSELSELGSTITTACKEKYTVEKRVNKVKEKDGGLTFELQESENLYHKGTKRKLSEDFETDLEEKTNTTTHGKSLHSHQELEHNHFCLSCEQNEVEYAGNDLQNSVSTSCTETADYGNTFSRFLEFIEKERKHFTKMVATEKMANFISIVAAHPNGTVVMIPSENMDDPEKGPGLILYEKHFPQNPGAI